MYKKSLQKRMNYQTGQAMLVSVMFFVLISGVIVFGIANPILKQVKVGYEEFKSKQSYFLASGAVEDVLYRLKNNKQISSTETISLNGSTVSTTIANTPTGKQIVATASTNSDIRKLQSDVSLGTGISFHYGVQSGQGGFILKNSSSVIGNIYSGGTVTGAGNYVYGDVISAGASGLVSHIHATGTVYAHTISNSIIDKDAYYATISGSTVAGVSHSGSADQAVAPLPISDAQITDWENDAASGGSVVCSGETYVIHSDITIGPKKIPCDLEISGSPTVTITGHIWVTGNITTKNSPLIKISPSLGSQNVAIIADKPSNRLSSGLIDIANSTNFQGSGSPGSFVFMISQNNSAENGGNTDAIQINNSANALVVYASHGQITLSNSTSLKEVTAYLIILQNSASVKYDTGLPSTLFESGPAGGYNVTDLMEVQ